MVGWKKFKAEANLKIADGGEVVIIYASMMDVLEQRKRGHHDFQSS